MNTYRHQNVKRLILALLSLCVVFYAWGQDRTELTQNGYVKTKGRMDGEGRIIAGSRITGATIILKGGNSTVSGENGTFSMSIPNKKYYLQNVLKNGFVLADPEVLSKQYNYSPNDMIIVMETPDDQLEEQMDAASRIRATLTAQLQKREREIKALKESNKITNEEYKKLRQELLIAQQNNERLINEMVEEYSKIDYDQLDDFNKQVSECILNGELTKADSLLRTKGTIESRIDKLKAHQEANRKEKEEIEQRQQNLERSTYYEQKEIEDIARDCYHYYTKCRLLQQNDSAAYYLEKRAMLDTLSFDYVWTCGSYFLNERKYDKAKYYLELLVRNESLSPVDMGMGLNDLSICYSYMGLDSLGIETIRKSLELREKLAKDEPEKYTVSVALASSNYAAQNSLYKGDKGIARKYFTIGMNLYKQLMTHTEFFAVNLANVEENYAQLLYEDSLVDLAEEYLLKAYNTRNKYLEQYPHFYNTTHNISVAEISSLLGNVDCDDFIATRECKMIIIAAAEKNKEQIAYTSRKLADLFFAKNDLDKCKYYLTKSRCYLEELFSTDAEKYLPDLTYSYMSNAYFNLNALNDELTADSIASKLFDLLQKYDVFSQVGFSKELALSDVLVLQGRIHQKHSLTSSIDKLGEAVNILQQVSESTMQEAKLYRLQEVYAYITSLYYQNGDITKAMESCKSRNEVFSGLDSMSNELVVANCVSNYDFAFLYIQKEDYDHALSYFRRAIEIMKTHDSLFSDIDYVQLYYYYGFTLYMVGNTAESLDILEDAQSRFNGLPNNEEADLLKNNINQAVEQIKQTKKK